MAICQRFQSGLKRARYIDQRTVITVLSSTYRNITADLVEHLLQRFFVNLIGRNGQTRCNHATANVHTDRCRNDGLVGGYDRTDGGTDAQMNIGHGCHMVVNKRQAGNMAQLLLRALVNVIRPYFDAHPLFGQYFLNRHVFTLC